MGVMEARRRILLNQPHLIDASGNPISFSTDMAAKMGVKAYFSPVQEGTGDPSPSNVRPISGWTRCTVSHSGADTSNPTTYPVTFPAVGKNLIDPSVRTITGNNAYWYTESGLFLQAGTYSFSYSKSITALYVKDFYTNAGIYTVYGVKYGTFTLNESKRVKLNVYCNNAAGSISVDDTAQLELGSTATSYEPFTNTLYGGYVDYEKGEVVATHISITADGVNVKANTAYVRQDEGVFGGGIVYLNPYGKTISYFSTCLVKANNIKVSKTYLTDVPYIFEPGAGWMYVIFYVGKTSEHPEITTNQECIAFTNSWLQEHPAQIVYELRDPITYPLTPTLIKSLKGANTIWSDTNGNVSLKYWKH